VQGEGQEEPSAQSVVQAEFEANLRMSQPLYDEEMEQAVIAGVQSAAGESAAASAAVAAVSSASAAFASPVAASPLSRFGASAASSSSAAAAAAASFAALTSGSEERKQEDEKKRSRDSHVALVYVLRLVFRALWGLTCFGVCVRYGSGGSRRLSASDFAGLADSQQPSFVQVGTRCWLQCV
jgi:hypothetical protein